MAFATEHPVVAQSEYRAIEEVVRVGGHFEVVSPHAPAGDQPAAIDELERRIVHGQPGTGVDGRLSGIAGQSQTRYHR